MCCSKYSNVGRMQVRLKREPLDKVDCLKYLGSQVTPDGRFEKDVVHIMNERCKRGER